MPSRRARLALAVCGDRLRRRYLLHHPHLHYLRRSDPHRNIALGTLLPVPPPQLLPLLLGRLVASVRASSLSRKVFRPRWSEPLDECERHFCVPGGRGVYFWYGALGRGGGEGVL